MLSFYRILVGKKESLTHTDQDSCGVEIKMRENITWSIRNGLFAERPSWFGSVIFGGYKYCIAFQMAL
jgi:hypothetical protein